MSRFLLHVCLFLVSSAAIASEVDEVMKVSDEDFDSKVVKSSIPVVVHFYAEWCGPCRMVALSLEELAGTMRGRVSIVRLDVDESPSTAAKYEFRSIPTLAIFKNGAVAARQVGAAPQHKLDQWIRAATSTKAPKSTP